MAAHPPTRTQGERADQTRARILDAAIRAFSENGLAGARTEQIAEEAGVNKALLYYYFRSKEALYAAALEQVVDSVRAESFSVMETKATAGERFVQMMLGNFDRSYSHPAMRSMIQQEMVRLHCGEENRIASMAEKFFRPLWGMVDGLLEEGISSGELVRVDPAQMRYAALGANLNYFLSAPLIKLAMGTDPLEPRELEVRRKVAVEYLGQTIFLDREHGARVAARVLARTPMPEVSVNGNHAPSNCNIKRHETSLKK
jgi:TetR/AcrR family transcriptional regulator